MTAITHIMGFIFCHKEISPSFLRFIFLKGYNFLLPRLRYVTRRNEDMHGLELQLIMFAHM